MSVSYVVTVYNKATVISDVLAAIEAERRCTGGEIILVEDKKALMQKLGTKQLTLHLQRPLAEIPAELASYPLELVDSGNQLVFTFDAQHEDTGIADLLRRLAAHGFDFKDLQSSQSSLEEIFVSLVKGSRT